MNRRCYTGEPDLSTMLRPVAILLFVAAAQAQGYPPAFPRDDARKLLENDRVVLWDVVWEKGRPSPVHEHRFDQISVTLRGGAVRVTRLDGTATVNHSEPGSVTPTAMGTVHREEGLSDVPQRKIMIELKPSAPAKRGAGGPPIEGAVKVMENDRVIAWDYTWKTGRAAAGHAGSFDSVWVFVEGGRAGQAVFVPAGEAGAAGAAPAPARAVIVELK